MPTEQSPWQKDIRRIRSKIKALIIVNVIFLFRTADWFETVGIAAAILLATLVSTLSERGSEAAFERLREEAARTFCRVRRAGAIVSCPADDVVIGS